MGMDGVEEEFWVGDDRFEVNASSDDAVGHGPPDIWVAHRKTLADLKKDVTRLERALAQELCTLDPRHFDLNRVYAQIQHAEENHFLRSFSEASRLHGQMRSQSVTSNTQVRQDLLIVAGEVRARWLR